MDYERPEAGVLTYRRPVGADGHSVVFKAEAIRRQTTGVHAKLSIGMDTTKLTSDTFNIERERERIHLAGIAFAGLNGVAKDYPRKTLEHDLMLFCDGLWPAFVATALGRRVAGDAEPTEAPFLLEPYILEEGGTILFAPPGSGKSYTAMLMAMVMDAGLDVLWRAQQAPVLYINLERGEKSMTRRLRAVNDALGQPPTTSMLMMNERGKTLADIYDAAAATVKREGARVVFLDSLSRGGFGNMNENHVANEAMDYLNALAPAWLAIAHTPRADASHVYGSQMFDAAADIVVQAAHDDKTQRAMSTLGVGLRVVKANDTPTTDWEVRAYEFDRFGLRAVRDAGRHEFPEIASEEAERSPEDLVYDILLAHGPRSGAQLAADTGKSAPTISRYLTSLHLQERVVVARTDGRTQFWAVKSDRHED